MPQRKREGHVVSPALPLVEGLIVQKTQPYPGRARLHMMMFLLHLASTPVYGFACLLSFSGERINGAYLSRQIVWAKTGRHGTALLDDGATCLESHSRLASAPFLKGDRKRGDDDSEASWVGVPTPRVWPAD